MPDDADDGLEDDLDVMTPLQIQRERLRTARLRADSLSAIRRNTFYTMLAVVAHTGYGVVRDPPKLPEPAVEAILWVLAVLT